MPTPIRAIAIMGATATGKSALAMSLALDFGGEIVSMDSRQVYRGFDVGTGKVSRDERAPVPHHLIDVADPDQWWSAGRHAALAERAVREIAGRDRVPLLVGGTGLYFRALFGGLVDVVIPADELARIRAGFAGQETRALYDHLLHEDPARARELSVNDRVRITRALELLLYTGVRPSELYARQREAGDDVAYLKLVLSMPRERLRQRIAERTRALFAAGWPAEVERLLASGVSSEAPAMNGLGYRAIARAVDAGVDPASCLDDVVQETQQYAKRQETFFRSEKDAVWVDVSEAGWEAGVEARVGAFVGLPPGRSKAQ
ncbi:MAG TPA: tRNA (adenosine(37)-N6)-dimethylallyltransferase MiaA [Candidatus Krumholzibacteria bacterium]|nr:tRNA (adenosine(37)-N6)-dimethylallyltransferase MiaA [Candidatus Krumholzibacteria bacterium]